MILLWAKMIQETDDKKSSRRAFTLFELMVVLAIIAAMVTVAVPYATRSNEAMKVRQECLSLAESVRYIADLAVDTKRSTRILVEPGSNSYSLEIANGPGVQDYEPALVSGDVRRYLSRNIRIMDITGFSVGGDGHYLLFEPARPWPNASISLSAGDVIKTIVIAGKRVEIQDSTI